MSKDTFKLENTFNLPENIVPCSFGDVNVMLSPFNNNILGLNITQDSYVFNFLNEDKSLDKWRANVEKECCHGQFQQITIICVADTATLIFLVLKFTTHYMDALGVWNKQIKVKKIHTNTLICFLTEFDDGIDMLLAFVRWIWSYCQQAIPQLSINPGSEGKRLELSAYQQGKDKNSTICEGLIFLGMAQWLLGIPAGCPAICLSQETVRHITRETKLSV